MDQPFTLAFDVAADEVDKLRRHKALRVSTEGRPTTRVEDLTFFADDAAKARTAGIDSGRLRQAGAGMFETLSLADCADPEILLGLHGLDTTHLRAAFGKRVSKVERRLALDGSLVDCVFEVGTLSNSSQTMPIARLRFAVQDGSPFRLFDLIDELRQTVALRIAVQEPEERGYASFTQAGPQIIRAESIDLMPQMSREAAYAKILRSCIEHWTGNEVAAVEARLPEGVHQMRVALRRLRAAISVFKGLMPVPREIWVKEQVRWLAGTLGRAREWDVFLDNTMAPVEAHFTDEPGLAMLRERASSRRDEGYRGLGAAVASERYTDLLIELFGWIALLDAAAPMAAAGDDIATFAAEKGQRLTARALRQGRDLVTASVEQRHELRLQLKKLRYAGEFFRSLIPSKHFAVTLSLVGQLQGILGEGNDLAVARDLLAKIGEPGTARAEGLLLGWHAAAGSLKGADLHHKWQKFEGARSIWR
jgi:CHAD domain-containing protein